MGMFAKSDLDRFGIPEELIEAFLFTWGVEGWSWYDDARLISDLMLRTDVTGDFVEIGCWKGKLSIILATVAKLRGRGERLVCVDPFEGWDYIQDGYAPPPIGHPLRAPTYEHFMNNITRIHSESLNIIKNILGLNQHM